MTLTRFYFTDRARPLLEVGIGSSSVSESAPRWDVSLWDVALWVGDEPLWRDVSCDVIEVTTDSGRGRIMDPFPVATANITVDNDSGWADPSTSTSDSPLTMRPGRPIRVGVSHTVLGDTWLWRGFIDAIEPRDAPDDWSNVVLKCVDALGEAGRAKLVATTETGSGEQAHQRFTRILDLEKWPETKRYVSTSAIRQLYAAEMDGQVVDLLRQTAESEGGWCFGDNNGDVVLQARSWLYTDMNGTPDATIGNVGASTVMFLEDPPGSGYMTYLGDAADWIESPVGSGYFEYVGVP